MQLILFCSNTIIHCKPENVQVPSSEISCEKTMCVSADETHAVFWAWFHYSYILHKMYFCYFLLNMLQSFIVSIFVSY